MIAPELPKQYVPTQTVFNGERWTPLTSADFQYALNYSSANDDIVLDSERTYEGNFVAPPKSGGSVLVRSDKPLKKPLVISPNVEPALQVGRGGDGWEFDGLQFTTMHDNTATTCYGIVTCGWMGEHPTKLEHLSRNIVFRNCHIHGTPTGNVRRGILFDVDNGAIINCRIEEIHEAGADSQAVWTLNGRQILIKDSTLEAAGENFMAGGDDSRITGHTTSDITISGCFINKPDEWQGSAWAVKNLLELKLGKRVLVEDCTLSGSWAHAQDGHAILLTVRNQYGTRPDSEVSDVTIRDCFIERAERGIDILSSDNLQPSRPIRNVLIESVHASDLKRSMFLFLNTDDGKKAENVAVRNCSWTFRRENATNFFLVGDKYANNVFCDGFEFSGNSGPAGEWGLGIGGGGSMDSYFANWSWFGNSLDPSHPSVPGDTQPPEPEPEPEPEQTRRATFLWSPDPRTSSVILFVDGEQVATLTSGESSYTVDLPLGIHEWSLACLKKDGGRIEVQGESFNAVAKTPEEPFYGATDLRVELL